MTIFNCLKRLFSFKIFLFFLFVNSFYPMVLFSSLGGGGNDNTTDVNILTVFFQDFIHNLYRSFFPNLALFFCLFYILHFLEKYLSKVLALAIAIFCYLSTFLVILIDLFLVIVFHNSLNDVFVNIILSTNPNEAIGFFDTYFNLRVSMIMLLFVVFSIGFLFIRLPKIHLPIQSKKLKAIQIVAFILFVICLFEIVYRNVYFAKKNIIWQWYIAISNNMRESSEFLKHYNQYKRVKQDSNDFLEQKKEYPIEIQGKLPQNIVLIIGESTTRNYMSLYGFGLPTTPHLEQLKKEGGLFVMNDIIAPHGHTNESLRKVLTFSNYENSDTPWYKQMNILNVMNLAGFETLWLSNQETISIYGNAPEVIATHANTVEFTMYRGSLYSSKFYDGALLGVLDKYRNNQSQKPHFYVLHLMGTHFPYIKGYPQSFNMLKPDDFKVGKFPNDAKTKAEYSNAVLYNDWVVNKIIEQFKESESIILYLSDHGEEVYDFRSFYGHNDFAGSRFMVEIPFILYLSPKARESFPNLTAKINLAVNRPFMTDDFIHAFLDILDIKTPDFEESRSLFSPNFNDKRVRKIFNGKDYDKEVKQQQCTNCEINKN
ncbi:hypothetical protein CQA53_09660 [Helicobacter didelphidarum]|uniref:Sulfatase N-terminal domain-containing protein n=1 Tax=Helicobacter didelphidarum TaxID=2040648 RepID=A0A3D8I9Z8_9HELI|nr:sulfatase-like hydrolase/transferase [Helicobacter didelphidarum]RDU61972.1 hypothetical protein CQA53_09660 [Helicobacter didelphidarum]